MRASLVITQHLRMRIAAADQFGRKGRISRSREIAGDQGFQTLQPGPTLTRQAGTPDEKVGEHYRRSLAPPEDAGRVGELILKTDAFARPHVHQVPDVDVFVRD